MHEIICARSHLHLRLLSRLHVFSLSAFVHLFRRMVSKICLSMWHTFNFAYSIRMLYVVQLQQTYQFVVAIRIANVDLARQETKMSCLKPNSISFSCIYNSRSHPPPSIKSIVYFICIFLVKKIAIRNACN